MSTEAPVLRRVVVLTLGGTIAMSAVSDVGAQPSLSGGELLAAVPALSNVGIKIDVHDFRQLPGASLTFDDLCGLAAEVKWHLDSGADGVIVTQGTDTIEETAYFLDIGHNSPQPVVVTGAMRHASLAGADGPSNILAAVQVAASPQARNLGVLVVMSDEIHAASRARKMHTTSVQSFASPNGGPLGYVIEGEAQILNKPPARFVMPGACLQAPLIRVGLCTVTIGDDGAAIDAMAKTADGLVIAALGAGHVPQTMVVPIERAAARVPIVLASRVPAGAVLSSTYAFAGSESDLLSRGLISAGYLDPYKARILLHRLLSQKTDPESMRTCFATASRATAVGLATELNH